MSLGCEWHPRKAAGNWSKHGVRFADVYAWRGERVRIISARRATPGERRQYEEER